LGPRILLVPMIDFGHLDAEEMGLWLLSQILLQVRGGLKLLASFEAGGSLGEQIGYRLLFMNFTGSSTGGRPA
jgi:hypothetical protein